MSEKTQILRGESQRQLSGKPKALTLAELAATTYRDWKGRFLHIGLKGRWTFLKELAEIRRGLDAGQVRTCRLQPRSGIFGDAFFGPEFEPSHQGILGQFFCDADIVVDSGNGGDEPCGLDLPHGLNRLRHIFHAC
jgi:hypothetical protein